MVSLVTQHIRPLSSKRISCVCLSLALSLFSLFTHDRFIVSRMSCDGAHSSQHLRVVSGCVCVCLLVAFFFLVVPLDSFSPFLPSFFFSSSLSLYFLFLLLLLVLLLLQRLTPIHLQILKLPLSLSSFVTRRKLRSFVSFVTVIFDRS